MNKINYIIPFLGLLFLVFAIIYRKQLIDIDKIYRFFVSNYQVPLEQRPWFSNPYCNVLVNTPFKLKVIDTQIQDEQQENIKSIRNFVASEEGYFIVLHCLETRFKSYKVQDGLAETINNLIESRHGSDVKLEFQQVNNHGNEIKATGTAQLINGIEAIHGYTYWDGKGKIVTIVATGENNRASRRVLKKIINEIKISRY